MSKSETGGVAVRLSILAEVLEAAVSITGTPGCLRIDFVEVLQHGLNGVIEAVQVEPIEADLSLITSYPVVVLA